jgi:Spy/CpxP family protein refolding chaperone
MRRIVFAAIAAASLVGSASTDSDGPPMHGMADRGFMLDARIAGMKAALNLTPEQEKSWAPFEAAVREAATMRMEAMRARREDMDKGERPSPIARMNEMSEHLAQASGELKKVAEAAKPLYDSLDETQKRHFGPLVMSLRGGGMPGRHNDHERGGEPL